ncbi:MAG TPA: polysaccharide deacetylase family protein [Thermoanaerobaculia bacterium]|jgi:peptidoglycan/xylan/chitin deacetylase (PgdA/CDA1 family)|nr:polysaccharide deacetylase family protein [Thermoanaerobaculia bacterium]
MSLPAAPSALPYEAELATPVGRAKELVKRALALTARPGDTLLRVATREPAIALTFDDGPDPVETPAVLELLERHGARGTFFMVGERAAAHPGLLSRVAAGGHAVANHSWDHPSFRRIGSAARAEQLRRGAAALAPYGVPLFRPPFGEQSVASLRDARRAGMQVVAWDVVAEDWRDAPAERVVERVLRRLRRGSIVVFHDALYVTEDPRYRDRAPMRQALDELLAQLSPAFRFVTIPELLALGRPVWGHHYHRLPASFHAGLAHL